MTVQIAPPPCAEGARSDGRFTGEVTQHQHRSRPRWRRTSRRSTRCSAPSRGRARPRRPARRAAGLAAPAPRRPRAGRVRRRGRTHRHHRVVQPLTGPRVAYPGEPGAFAEDAVLRFFAAPEPVALPSFRAVFEAVRDGDADAGVVPVESSLLGTIRENLDLLWAFELPIVGEVSVPVRLALLALPGRDARVHRARVLDLGRAGPGRRVPALPAVERPDHVQHRRRREAGRRARPSAGRRPSRPRGSPRSTGSRSSPTTSSRAPTTGPGSR